MSDRRGMFAAGPSAPTRWQDQYALPDWQKRLTELTPQQEAQFQAWVAANRVPITPDYDMRGFWLSGDKTQINQNDHMIHYSDRFKTPLHQSFSGESIYADPAASPPMWTRRDQLVDQNFHVLFDERAKR